MGKLVEKAKVRVVELEQMVSSSTTRATEKSLEGDALEATIGEAALDSAEPDRTATELADRVVRLRVEAKAATSTADAAQRRLEVARADVHRASADEWDDQARDLHRQHGVHEAKLARLLDEIEQLEGVRFVPPEQPARDLAGNVIGTTTALTRSAQLLLDARRAAGHAVALRAEAAGTPLKVPTSLLDGAKQWERLAEVAAA